MVVFVTHLDRGIAVIVVDLVNDFVSGKFGSERGIEVAGNTAKFLKILNGRYPVIFTLDTHVPGDPEFRVWGEHHKQPAVSNMDVVVYGGSAYKQVDSATVYRLELNEIVCECIFYLHLLTLLE